MWNLAEGSEYDDSVYEGILLRRVAVETVRCSKPGTWLQKTSGCRNDFQWQGVGADQVHSWSERE